MRHLLQTQAEWAKAVQKVLPLPACEYVCVSDCDGHGVAAPPFLYIFERDRVTKLQDVLEYTMILLMLAGIDTKGCLLFDLMQEGEIL